MLYHLSQFLNINKYIVNVYHYNNLAILWALTNSSCYRLNTTELLESEWFGFDKLNVERNVEWTWEEMKVTKQLFNQEGPPSTRWPPAPRKWLVLWTIMQECVTILSGVSLFIRSTSQTRFQPHFGRDWPYFTTTQKPKHLWLISNYNYKNWQSLPHSHPRGGESPRERIKVQLEL